MAALAIKARTNALVIFHLSTMCMLTIGSSITIGSGKSSYSLQTIFLKPNHLLHKKECTWKKSSNFFPYRCYYYIYYESTFEDTPSDTSALGDDPPRNLTVGVGKECLPSYDRLDKHCDDREGYETLTSVNILPTYVSQK